MPDDVPGPCCPRCGCTLVYPTRFESPRRGLWRLSLRCPNCEWAAWQELDDDGFARLERELDGEREELVAELVWLARANMTEELERFAAALECDAILPMDF